MSRKVFTQVFILILALLVSFAIPGIAKAGGGACGGTYIVQWGDTLDVVAWRCGTTVSAIYNANPGISGYLYAGQMLVIPGNGPCYNCQGGSYANTYTVRPGDTFAGIAYYFGVSVNDLWAANPYIYNINQLYTGQVLYIPAVSSWGYIVPTPTYEPLVPRSAGSAPAGTPYATVKLSNKAKAQVYVSLQGTTPDGYSVINEYPVSGNMNVRIPAGWYTYVAWVGGEKYVGNFHLGGSSNQTITFYSNKVVVE